LQGDFLRVLFDSLVHEIFCLSNDAFAFMDVVVEWNFERLHFDSVVDFHRFEAVFQRAKGW